jgi:hypothetical protein
LSDLNNLTKLQNIEWTDTGTALELQGSDYHDFISTLSKINSGVYDAHITELTAADTAMAEADTNITQFSVKDTAAELSANFDALQASASAGTVKVQAIEQNGAGDVALSYTQYSTGSEAVAMMGTGSITATVSDVAIADTATVLADSNITISSVAVSDTAANISSDIVGDGSGVLETAAAASKVTAIKVSDSGVLALASNDAYVNSITAGGVLDILSQNTGGNHATITDLTTAHEATATGDANIDSFTITDDAAGLAPNFADLVAANTAGKLTGVTQSDAGTAIDLSLSDFAAHATDYAATLNKFAALPAIQLT